MFFLLFSSFNAYSQNDTTINFTQTCKENGSVFKAFSITGNIIRCIERVVNLASDKLIDNYIAGFATFVFYMTMMAILFFSIKVMFGVASSRGITLVFVLKIIFVLAFTSPSMPDTLKGFRDTFMEAPKYFSVIILKSMDFDSTLNVSNDEEKVTTDIFDLLDIYLLKLFGVEKPPVAAGAAETENFQEEVFIGLAALVAGLFFTGPIGFSIATIALGFVFAIIFAMAQAILFYATIVIAMNFLIALSPLVATAILFEPFKRITAVWFVSFVGYAVQPLIFVAFMGLTLKCLDSVVLIFKPTYQKVQLKLDNVNGEKKTYATLFNCGTFKDPETSSKENKTSHIMGDFILSRMSGFSNNSYLKGARNYATATDTKNDPSVAITKCRITAPVINLDYSDPKKDPLNSQKVVRLTEDDLVDLKAAKFTVILLMLLLMGFMKELPQLINGITSQAIIAPVSAGIGQQGGVVEAPIRAVQQLGGGITQTARGLIGR